MSVLCAIRWVAMAKFGGVYTALVTPFAADGSVDYSLLERLVERQVQAGVAGVVPVRLGFVVG